MIICKRQKRKLCGNRKNEFWRNWQYIDSWGDSLKTLLKQAIQVRENAYAPYSKFKVGAAVRGKSGQIYLGCNVENASYGLTSCAERNAIFQAIAQGEQNLSEILVVADTQEPVVPCGACRQVMQEFGIKTVYRSNLAGTVVQHKLSELLPIGFKSTDMEV